MKPSKERLADAMLGFKVFKRVPYTSRFKWNGGTRFTLYTPECPDKGEDTGLTGFLDYDIDRSFNTRAWFDGTDRWEGAPNHANVRQRRV